MKKRGGKRKGAGRKKSAETVTTSVRFVRAELTDFRVKHPKKLNKMANDWLRSVIYNHYK